MDGVEECRGSVLLKGVRGKIIPEIFEKSIDKHKIDAILNAPSDRNGSLEGAVLEVGVTRAGGFHGRIRHNHPDTACEEFAGSFYVFETWKGTVQGNCAHCLGVFFEKC